MKKKIFVAAVLCLFLGVMSQAATITVQVATPTVGGMDIAQLLSATSETTNVTGVDDDEFSYVAGDRETQGQSFTIQSSSTLNGIWVRHVNYPSWSGTFVGGNTITVRVCSVSGTALTLKSSEVATIAAGVSLVDAWPSQQWIHIALAAPVSLSPGTYAFDVTGETACIEITGVNTNPYAGGNAYTTGDNLRYELNMTRSHPVGDRTFILELEPGDTAPHAPQAIPENLDGSVGTLTGLTVEDVDLTFKAGTDPNYPVNGGIVHSDTAGFVIRLQTGAPTDPNLYIIGTMGVGSMDDPARTLPAGVLNHSITYQWQVEQLLNDPSDPNDPNNPYPPGDPHNISGGVWSFTTVSAIPSITDDPDHTLADPNDAPLPNATLTVVASATATDYRWFKVGDPDIKLTDGTIDGVDYSDTQTATLKIAGMADDGTEDAQYYAIAYNGDPEGAGLASAPSATAWVWSPREVHRWTFESAGGGIVADMIGSSDIQLISGDGGPDLASIVNTPAAPELVGQSLYLNNPNVGGDPNIADGQYGRINDTMVSAYADITISAWIYHKGGGWQRILGFGNSNGSGTGSVNGQHLYFTPAGNGNNGQLMLNIHDSSVAAPAGGAVPINEWAYVTATVSGNTAKLFVNGEWIATNTNFTADPIADAPVTNNCIGRCQWYIWDSLYNGYIADLRIWNYGLSTAEVGEAYLADDTSVAYVCDIEGYNLPYDLNENCAVDLEDLKLFAATWLDSYRIYPD